ncbi:MAG: hypothetical protein ACFB14_07150 [Leptolyngbyaceae cyanobacterium]
MITLVPTSGLCNRMRAIASAVSLSKHLGRELEVIWIPDSALGCSFNQLFEPLPCIRVIQPNKITKHLYQENQFLLEKTQNKFKNQVLATSSSFCQKMICDRVIGNAEIGDIKTIDLIDEVSKSRKPLLITNRHFYNDLGSNLYEVFEPIKELKASTMERTANFNEYTIGLHIRRGDHVKSIVNSPLSVFKKAIKNEIDVNSKANFYVASDSIKDKESLKKAFGSRITTDFEQTSRDNDAGMKAALIDLYSLSKTRKIYGSYWSSFSRVSAEISGIELIRLVKDSDDTNVMSNVAVAPGLIH